MTILSRFKAYAVFSLCLLQQVACAQGELGPHFLDKNSRYIGEFFQNHAYIRADEGGNFGGKLAGNKFAADVWIAREDAFVLYKQPNADKFAIIDPSDPKNHNLKPTDLNFQLIPNGGLLVKAWERANNPSAYPKDKRTGKLQAWIFVDLVAAAKQTERFFVGTEIKTEPESGLHFIPVLVVNEQRSVFFLDPDRNKFAPVSADLLGTPLEEMKYREMDAGGVGEAVWKFISTKNPK